MKIYILEDDSSIRELVVYTLNRLGYEARGFEVPSEFYAGLKEALPDLVLLDIMLPEEDGIEVLNKLKRTQKYSRLPVIMLTAKTTEYDKVRGLDSGADDYVTKPFGMMELVARIKAVMRRTNPKTASLLTFENVTIDKEKHEVRVDGELVELRQKEYQLLEYLMENAEIVISRERLLEFIWGYAFDGENRTVDVHIRSLRKKLGEGAKIIKTVRGFGYKIGSTS